MCIYCGHRDVPTRIRNSCGFRFRRHWDFDPVAPSRCGRTQNRDINMPVEDNDAHQRALEIKALVLNLVPTPVMAIDRDFSITYMNRAGAQLGGLTQEECVGRKCHEVFKTPHCRTEECRCHRAMSDGQMHTGDTTANPQGTEIPIRYTGAPRRDEQGEIVGAVEFVLDITEEVKVAEEAGVWVNPSGLVAWIREASRINSTSKAIGRSSRA